MFFCNILTAISDRFKTYLHFDYTPAKPAAKQGRKATGLTETAGLPRTQ